MGILYEAVKEDGELSSFSQAINVITRRNKSLYIAFFQLTPFCNLKCRMCYARLEPQKVLSKGKNILGFDGWKFFIDEAVKEGLSEVAFTGGECTLHPDFCEIYSYAYDQGLQISVMTNATYLTDRIYNLWKNKPPMAISITIYGYSADTYGTLCGSRAACDKVYKNIERLDEAGFNLTLKYTSVRDNLNDLHLADQFCRKLGYVLHATHVLTQFDQCTSDVIKRENADEEEFKAIMKQIRMERSNEKSGNTDTEELEEVENSCDLEAGKNPPRRGILCSAARNSCYIDWEGRMLPCVAFDAIILDPVKTGFHECWKKMTSWADRISVLEECISCIYKYQCNRCVALHYNDTGEFNKVSSRLCWKRKYPLQAAKVEAKLIDQGLIPSKDSDV